jgi:hypothetical protein
MWSLLQLIRTNPGDLIYWYTLRARTSMHCHDLNKDSPSLGDRTKTCTLLTSANRCTLHCVCLSRCATQQIPAGRIGFSRSWAETPILEARDPGKLGSSVNAIVQDELDLH